MRSEHTNRQVIEIDPKWRVGIVFSSFYKEEMEHLVSGANNFLVQSGMEKAKISLHEAAGSFEVPLIGSALAEADAVDALIGLGIIVEGQTHHADLLARESARGIMDVQLSYDLPFAFEILYVNDLVHARERVTGPLNKGAEAAYAVLHSLAQLKRIRSEKN